ncbi:MAG: YeeE/YedE family protein [Flavobacteriaceae bacterium]|nr:YeeE/YedE family protein [Flavobacteriaceae bacterium]
MKYIKFLAIGILFGIVMTKAETVSWYRIYEMFKFQSFHMYGIIGSTILLGTIMMYMFKKGIIKDYKGIQISVTPKSPAGYRTVIGGVIFGFGWALAGACPGPMYVLIGHGVYGIVVVLAGALLGAFIFGLVKDRLPK